MKKYFIFTIGCQMNKSDSERIAGYLESIGFKQTDSLKSANLIVLMTCGVRQSAEDKAIGLVARVKRENQKAKILFTGCLVYREDLRKKMVKLVDYWLPVCEIPNSKYQIPNKIQIPNTKFQKYKTKLQSDYSYLCIPPKYSSEFTAFVPIGNGCNNFCAYCVVPYARGREVYRPAEEIIDEVRGLVAKGYKEIILIAQNVNSYKSGKVKTGPRSSRRRYAPPQDDNKEIDFAKLLRSVNSIPGEFWIRFATSHPKDMSDELIKTMVKCKKVCEHVHLPVQAGDDAILRAMNRNYTTTHYKTLVKRIRHEYETDGHELRINGWKFPLAIATDVIVGFPHETRKQFENTVKLFKDIKFDQAYIAHYSERPGTTAAKLNDNVSKEEKKRREQKLQKILHQTALANNKKYLYKIVTVLIEEKNRKGEWIGRTRTNKNVKCQMSNVENNPNLLGEFVKVKIFQVQDFGLEGEMVEVVIKK